MIVLSRWLVVWLFGWIIYGISTFVGYLTPYAFYANIQFYVKLFSLTWVYSLIVKNGSISNNSVQLKYAVSMSKQFYFKLFSLVKQF